MPRRDHKPSLLQRTTKEPPTGPVWTFRVSKTLQVQVLKICRIVTWVDSMDRNGFNVTTSGAHADMSMKKTGEQVRKARPKMYLKKEG